jgi:hypothetical protein
MVKKKYKVAHYENVHDPVKYPHQTRSIYNTRVREIVTIHNSKLHEVSVQHSEHDISIFPKWHDVDLIRLEEDGNGINVVMAETSTNTTSIYLDYSQALELMLALTKWHELNKYGQFKKYMDKK